TAAPADAEEDRFNPSRTTLRIELLMRGDGAAVDAQHWSRTLAGLGYPARIRQPIRDDQPEVSESTRGPLRFVSVIGTLDNRGNLVFPGRTFTPGQGAELKEWLDELKTYGAQGSPEGRPLWGLDRSQFEAVYQALSQPVEVDVTGLPLADALAKLPLPAGHPLRFTAAAKEALDAPGATSGVSQSVAGLTVGTGLAFVLHEHGLGFRPERTPEGTIELSVVPLPESESSPSDAPLVVWPVGWEIEEPTKERGAPAVKDKDAVPPNRVQIAPTLFAMAEIGFQNVPVTEALAAAEAATGVPMLLDRRAVAAAGIDLSKARATLPARRTSWSLALRYVTSPNRLRHDLRRDERGNPLVRVTPIRTGR
ncbi:MAG TPA: hypothetical protein VF170_01615, partial [Planctomycetaceae bacterium]